MRRNFFSKIGCGKESNGKGTGLFWGWKWHPYSSVGLIPEPSTLDEITEGYTS